VTPREANPVLLDAEAVMRGRRAQPLAWAIARTGGRDLVAEAWEAADDAATLRALLGLLSPDALGALDDRLPCWPHAPEMCRLVREARPSVTLADVLGAMP
jgi:hypothetical protein